MCVGVMGMRRVLCRSRLIAGWSVEQIDFEARPPHPRSFEVDHVVSSDEAERLGWSSVGLMLSDNCQAACRQCNREKSSGERPTAAIRPTYVNPRFM